jgi:hypothetical protein
VENIADNGNFDPLQQLQTGTPGIQMAAEGKQIQQTLGGMFVQSIPGIENAHRGSAAVDLGS